MKLSELGEFGLIDRFAKTISAPAGVVGIGDDCAVIPQTPDRSLLVTTDLLVEGVHFSLATTSARDLGHKALAVNLSDIAAMGGRPRSAFLSLALPTATEVAWLDEFFAGVRELAEHFDVAILGGDTTRSIGGLTMNITALGDVAPSHVKLRSAARVGDVICVTRSLGDSAAGLRLLQAGVRSGELVSRHLRPEPSVTEGVFFGAQPAVHAMMDLSDGLQTDITRILSRSACGAEIDLDALPISSSLRAACAEHGWDATALAAAGGEDYGLLLTVDTAKFAGVARSFGAPLIAIGRVTAKGLTYLLDGKVTQSKFKGFKHF